MERDFSVREPAMQGDSLDLEGPMIEEEEREYIPVEADLVVEDCGPVGVDPMLGRGMGNGAHPEGP